MKVCRRHPGGPMELPDVEFYKNSAVCKGCQYREKLAHPRFVENARHNNHTYVSKWHHTRASAVRRGVEFFLTKEQFEKILQQPCAYGNWQHGSATPVGIDRKDNAVGYTIENSIACCGRHNHIKSDWASYEDMLQIVKQFPTAQNCGTRGGRKCLNSN